MCSTHVTANECCIVCGTALRRVSRLSVNVMGLKGDVIDQSPSFYNIYRTDHRIVNNGLIRRYLTGRAGKSLSS